MTTHQRRTATLAGLAILALGSAGCATLSEDPPEPSNPPRKEIIYAVTASHQLIAFNAGQPQKILSKKALTGLAAGEEILGIDYRVAKGVLFALGRAGDGARLVTLDTATGAVKPVGTAPLAVKLDGNEFGFDFNPTVDRIRVASDSGQNLRLHPDTGAVVDANPNEPGVQTDGRLAFAAGDANAGVAARIVAAGYTYNKVNDKITTNYAIDAATGSLVMQGSKEGTLPPVSPNTGQLFTVGKLNAGPFVRAALDIADTTGAAFAGLTREGGKATRFYLVNLDTGAATFLGTIGGGEPVRGLSFEP
ncbi:MAG: DUF4394 domain-containing protein [Betaproteobacteria bacterium]|nr:DUF4394 domain-containing protein [Betaproteobacteria bacterium]